ncbi:hypothetical protein, partial [Butyricicoccus sp.]|uniref:hypothetical protein n=1 Tax=Butyricicoccus sp. TaxID=2049021 RepID=UPI003D7D51CA
FYDTFLNKMFEKIDRHMPSFSSLPLYMLYFVKSRRKLAEKKHEKWKNERKLAEFKRGICTKDEKIKRNRPAKKRQVCL